MKEAYLMQRVEQCIQNWAEEETSYASTLDRINKNIKKQATESS